jgi:hypothetical protein
MTEAPHTMCGYIQADTSICFSPSVAHGHYCPTHDGLECAGCGKKAIRGCPYSSDGESHCEAPLCEHCEHRIAAGHGPKITVRDAAYEELCAALKLSLEDSAAKGLLTIPEGKGDQLASKTLNDFSMHVTMKVLSGIAQAPR